MKQLAAIKHIYAKIGLGIFFGIILSLVFSPFVAAEEVVLSVSGNGNGSDSQVLTTTSSTTSLSQTNQADIQNNTQSAAETGNNQASSNTSGDTQIQTGDIHTTSDISNQANTNVVTADDCACQTSTTSIEVNGNGADSTNTVNASKDISILVGQNNTAHITNILEVYADTGNNTANDNNGNTHITTGDIHASSEISNIGINKSISNVFGNTNSSLQIEINGNGSGSQNNVNIDLSNNISTFFNNVLDIQNNVLHDLNTGKNIANGNNGNVSIVTGTILSSVSVKNQEMNENADRVSCQCIAQAPPAEENPPAAPQPPVSGGVLPPLPVSPSVPSQSVGNPQGGETILARGGEILGAAISGILPVTGGNYWLLIALLANSMMFFWGWYLRMRSGRSPGRLFVLS